MTDSSNPYGEGVDPFDFSPSAQKEPNPYGGVDPFDFGDVEEQLAPQRDEGAILRSLYAHAQTAPNDYDAALRISKQNGLDVDVVHSRLKDFVDAAAEAEFDPKVLRETQPEIADFLLREPDLAPVVMRDEKVSIFSKILTGARGLTKLTGTDSPASMAMPYYRAIFDSDSVERGIAEKVIDGDFQAALDLAKDELGFGPPRKVAVGLGGENQDGPILPQAAEVWSREFARAEISRLGTKAMYLDQMAASSGEQQDVARALAMHRKIAQLNEQLGPDPLFETGELGQFFLDANKGAASSAGSFLQGGKGAIAGGVIAGGAALAGTRKVGVARKAAVAGAKIGGLALGGVESFEQEAGSAYMEFLQQRDDQGNVMDPQVARGAAVVYGTLSSLVEMGELSYLGKLTGLGKAVRGGTGKAELAKMMKDRRFRSTFAEVGKVWAKSAAAEGIEEATQTTIQFLTGHAAQTISAGQSQSFDRRELERQQLESFYFGVAGGVGIGTVTGGAKLATHSLERRRAKKAAATIINVAEMADTPTSHAAPHQLAELIERQTEVAGRPATHIYIDPIRLTEALGGEENLRDEAVRLLGENGAERIRKAIDDRIDEPGSRASLKIPIAEFLERFDDGDVARKIAVDATTSPALPTLREQAEQSVADEEFVQQRAKELVADLRNEDAIRTPTESEFIENLSTQLEETGQFSPDEVVEQTAIARAQVETMAQRLNTTPDEVMTSFNTRIRKVLPTAEALREDFDALSPGDQQAKLYRDGTTGLLNARGLNVAPVTEGRPTLAVFEVESFKFINDQFGHEAGDKVLNLMANVLKQHTSTAAKVGGSLFARVSGAAEIQQLNEAMQAIVGDTVRVVSAADPQGSADALTAIEGAQNAMSELKSQEYAAGRFGHRKGVPSAVLEDGDPVISYEEGFPGLPADSPQAEALNERGRALLQPVVDQALTAEPTAPADLGADFIDAFNDLGVDSAFDAINYGAEGLLTGAGFARTQELQPRAFSASADLRNLRDINNAFGREDTNKLLAYFSAIMKDVEGVDFDAAHLHGDEYAAQANDRKQLRGYLEDVATLGRELFVYKQQRDGSYIVLDGLHFAYGIARSFQEADSGALKQYKEQQGDVPKPERLSKRQFASRTKRLSQRVPLDLAEYDGSTVAGATGRTEGKGSTERLLRSHVEALVATGGKRAAIRAALSNPDSPFSRAHADILALHQWGRSTGAVARRVSGGVNAKIATSIDGALRDIMSAGRVEDSPTPQNDAEFIRGEKPSPDSTTIYDDINVLLDLKGDERVSSLPEAFQALMRHHRDDRHPLSWDVVGDVVEDLRGVSGLEDLQLPQEVLERRADELEQERVAESLQEAELNEDGDLVDDDGNVLFQSDPTDPRTPKELEAELRSEFGVKLNLSDRGEFLVVDRIVVPEDSRSKGTGTTVMQAVVKYADATGRTVALSPSTDFGATSKGRLEKFYRRFGFEPNKGKAREFAVSESMTRRPKGDILFQEDPPEGSSGARHRGWVHLARDAMKRTFSIFLDSKADVSTPLHELAHTYLEMLGDIAERDDAPEQIKEDWERAKSWLGVADRSGIGTAQQEQWARGFEAYIMEGNAPSRTLVETFQRLRAWMLRIYKSIADLGVELSDDVRGVFDRMLATDDEIAAMQAAMGIDKPFFRSAKEMGASEAEFQRYRREREETLTRAAVRLQRDVAESQRAVISDEWRKAVAKNRERAEHEFNALPASRAWRYLRRGEVWNEHGEHFEDLDNREQGKLDKKAFRRIMRSGSKLESSLKGRFAKHGMDPAELAERFGFSSGREMLEAVANRPNERAWVNERAEQLTQDSHPELLFERERLEEAAASALHQEGTADSLVKEWEMLLSLGKIPGVPHPRVLELAARELVADKPAGRIAPGQALTQERRAAEKAVAAAARGDFGAAAMHKRNQLIAHFQYRELDKARRQRDRFLKLAKRLTTPKQRGMLGKAGKPFLDAMDEILEAMKLKEREANLDVLQDRTEISKAIEMLESEGFLPGFDVGHLLNLVLSPESRQKGHLGWKGLTLDEFGVVHDAISQLYVAARDANSVVLDGQRVQLQNVSAKIAEEAAAINADKGQVVSVDRAILPVGRKKQNQRNRVSGILAAALDPEQALNRLGATGRSVWDGYLKSRETENDLSARVMVKFNEMWERLPESLRARRDVVIDDVDGVELPQDLDREAIVDRKWMWMVALNVGNESNKERLLGGYGWEEGKVLKWLDRHMEQADWEFVQSIWDLLDKELFPGVASVHEQVNGIPPPKIPATPVPTKFGVFRGGYFPAKYDPVTSRVGALQEAAPMLARYGSKPGQVSIMKSFTKERAKSYADTIALDWSVMPGHVASVIHYIAFERFVRDGRKILGQAPVKKAITRRLGVKHNEQFKDWLDSVASYAADSVPEASRDLLAPFQFVKNSFTMTTLGFSLTVAAGDLTNPFVSWAKGDISAISLSTSLVQTLGGLRNTRLQAEHMSPELRHRRERRTDELRRMLMGVSEGRVTGLRRKAMDMAFWLFDATDKLASTVIWNAAMRDRLAKGLDPEEAIRESDAAIRAVLPSFAVAEQPRILRDRRSLGGLIVFYSYFSKLTNVHLSIAQPVAKAFEDDGAVAGTIETAKAAGRMLAVVLVANVFAEFLSGRGPEEGEEPEEWALRKALSSPFSMIPVFGFLGEGATNELVSYLFHGKFGGRRLSVRSSPHVAAATMLLRSVGKMADDGADSIDRVLNAMTAAGMATGLPLGTSQVRRTLGYALGGELERDVGRGDALGVAEGLIYGRRDEQPANPFSVLR